MTVNKAVQKIIKPLFITGVILIIAAFVGILYMFPKFIIDEHKKEMAWRETLTPLSQETIGDLCDIFELKSGEDRCNTLKQVYSYQF